ncbi:type VII secretion protein EccB, partial [Klebsiella pneumoniae]|nr:type VII secretion protein EccB [Klebsiella pneumoniae]
TTNLASARLIVGSPQTPKVVKDSSLNDKPRGQLMGILDAPENLAQRKDTVAQWTVCDRHTDDSALSLTKTDVLSTTLF